MVLQCALEPYPPARPGHRTHLAHHFRRLHTLARLSHVLRLSDFMIPNVCGATVGCEIFMRVAHHARLCGAACRGRKATLYVCMSHVLRGICPARASVSSSGGAVALKRKSGGRGECVGGEGAPVVLVLPVPQGVTVVPGGDYRGAHHLVVAVEAELVHPCSSTMLASWEDEERPR